jgi:hypothetical protein
MAINTSQTLGVAFDSSGLYRQVSSGTAADDVFVFASGTDKWRIADDKGPYLARLGGVLPGSDMTYRLNTIFLNSGVSEVVIDNGNITISGTLNCQGKKLTFRSNGAFIGSGTVNGCVIDAEFNRQIFSTSMTINPVGVSNRYFSVKWFGAKGDNGNSGTTDEVPIQKTIDTLIRNYQKLHNVYFPEGIYVIAKPIIAHNWNGTFYQTYTVNLIGETSFYEAAGPYGGSTIRATFTNSFALGIQRGKGCRIMNLKIEGAYAPPDLSNDVFFSTSWENYSDSGCRNQPFSPYAGIVIDPFSHSSTTIPSDGGYQGTDAYGVSLSTYYRGNDDIDPSTGDLIIVIDPDNGSTGIVVDECVITNFIIGIITSPNGTTKNAELLEFNRIQFANVKGCIAGCQDQEKMNRASFLSCWGDTHTILVFNKYGASSYPSVSQVGHWVIENVNIAGKNHTLCSRSETGYFPMKISSVYAESLGRIGDINFTMGSSISDSVFDFVYPAGGTYASASYDILATGVCGFKNCLFRYYTGDGIYHPIVFNGRFAFDKCRFTVPPIQIDGFEVSQTGYRGNTMLDNCYVGSGLINLGALNPQSVLPENGWYFYADGKNIIRQEGNLVSGIEISHSPRSSINQAYFLQDLRVNGGSAVSIAVSTDGNREVTITAPSSSLAWLRSTPPSVVAFYNTNLTIAGVGIVTNIGASTFKVSYITGSMPDGNYRVYVYRTLQFLSFLGDVTAGSNVISNVRIDIGRPDYFAGKDNIFIQNVGNVTSPDGIEAFSIDSWNNTTKQFTCSTNFDTTATGVYFSNNGYIKNISSISSSYNILNLGYLLVQKGGRITMSENGETKAYIVTKSGYIDAASQTDTRQAEWAEDPAFLNGVISKSANYTLVPFDDTVEVDSTSGNVTINLPTAAKIKGKEYTIKKVVAANSVIVDGSGAETIDGAATYTMTAQWKYVRVRSNGTNWIIVANN